MTVGQRFLTYYFKFLFSAQECGDHISHVALFVALQSVKTVSNRLHTLHKLCQKFDVGIFEWANPITVHSSLSFVLSFTKLHTLSYSEFQRVGQGHSGCVCITKTYSSHAFGDRDTLFQMAVHLAMAARWILPYTGFCTTIVCTSLEPTSDSVWLQHLWCRGRVML